MRGSALAVALFFSGFAALAVEVVWHRLLTEVLGGSTVALTAVLTAYMGGLAAGAALGGRIADRLTPAQALRGYVGIEVGVWLVISLVTMVLQAIPTTVGGVLASIPEGTPRFVVRFAFASLLLSLPTTAMGATLPLAVRAATGGELVQRASRLYAANTLGAVTGALVGPFVLVAALGVRNAILASAVASLVAASVALGFRDRGAGESSGIDADADAPPSDERAPPNLVLLLAATTGAAALGLEVIWTRVIGTLAGSTVYAFGGVLALMLSGIAIGSFTLSRFAKIAHPAAASAVLATLAATLAVLLLPVLDLIPVRWASLAEQNALDFGSSLTALMSVSALAIVPAAMLFGAAFPLAIAAVRGPTRSSAQAVGSVSFANTVGALTGASQYRCLRRRQ